MEEDGESGNLLDLTSTENRWSVERGLYQFKINILIIIWWVYSLFMSGASACLTLYIIQAIKLPLTGLPIFFVVSYHCTHTYSFLRVGKSFNMFSFSTFLLFSCCLFLLLRAAQKQISCFKKLLYPQFPMIWGLISSHFYCAEVWFLT